MHEASAITTTNLPLPARREGKVRDVYDLQAATTHESPTGPPRLLIVATDRVSAFDVVMPTPIPGKGRLLTQISAFWFRFIERHSRVASPSVGGAESCPSNASSAAISRALAGRTTRQPGPFQA